MTTEAARQPGGSVDLRKVRRFHTALRLALHDQAVDPKSLTFIFDADVVIGAIQGLTFFTDPAPDVLDTRFVVRALISTNALGPIHMVRPHLLEFDRVLHSWPDPHTPMGVGFHEAQMRQLMTVWGLDQYDKDLADPDALSGLLASHGYDFFIKVELCFGGTWQQRLQRLLRSGAFAFAPLSTVDRLDFKDPGIAAFATALETGRSDTQINNLMDAAAVSILQRLANERQGREYRFYTDTIAVRSLFSADSGKGLADESQSTMLRDEDYFLMRVSFPQLTHAGVEGEPAGDTRSPFKLKEISDELTDVLDSKKSHDRYIAEAIRRMQLHDVPLPDLIDEFFRLKFVRTVMLKRWSSPEALASFLPNVGRAFRDDALSKAQAQLKESFQEVRQNLTDQVGWLRSWKADHELVMGAMRTRRRRVGEKSDLPKLDTDLGLARWGVTRTLRDPARLQDFIACALQGSDVQVATASAQFALEMAETVRDVHDGEFQIIALWFLQLYPRLCTFWRTRLAHHSRTWSGLRALYLVASVKHSFERSLQQVDLRFVREFDQLIAAADEDVGGVDESQRPFALMAKAHVGYWAWKRANDSLQPLAVTIPSRLKDLEQLRAKADGWARESFIAGARAAERLFPPTIEWAFAINHCAYLGYQADIFRKERDEYYQMLNRNAALHQHYRFADTLATPFTLSARNIIARYGIEALGERTDLGDQRAECRYNLLRARRFLTTASPSYGDEEFEVHLAQIENWLRELPEPAAEA